MLDLSRQAALVVGSESAQKAVHSGGLLQALAQVSFGAGGFRIVLCCSTAVRLACFWDSISAAFRWDALACTWPELSWDSSFLNRTFEDLGSGGVAALLELRSQLEKAFLMLKKA